MKGFVANHEDFVEVCPEKSTISQREKACRELVRQNVDNYKRIDFYTDQNNARKSCYLLYKNQKLYLCSYVYRRPPSHIGNWRAYEYARVIDKAKPFESEEEAIEWVKEVREEKIHLSGVVNAVAWSDSANHCYMNENRVIQEIKDVETPSL